MGFRMRQHAYVSAACLIVCLTLCVYCGQASALKLRRNSVWQACEQERCTVDGAMTGFRMARDDERRIAVRVRDNARQMLASRDAIVFLKNVTKQKSGGIRNLWTQQIGIQ